MSPSPHRLALAAVGLFASASLAACHSKNAPAPAPSASAASSSRADLFANQDDIDLSRVFTEDSGAPGAAGGDGPADDPGHGLEIVLKDAGTAPRTPLTYDLAVGKPQIAVLTVKEEGESGGAGDMPPLRLTLSVVAGEKPGPESDALPGARDESGDRPGREGGPAGGRGPDERAVERARGGRRDVRGIEARSHRGRNALRRSGDARRRVGPRVLD